ncbi:leucine-rich repeat domain-containing protein [Candidatus Rhabdochlamydia sp. T3358]|uniref:leucine-rich repeat domain-containing protein n=1 Tax=Candidatus Rhabdochlamydia sp. T3358 TaxID=2099795 RepID=UPI0010B6FBF0|nr:leucine-rich repeat domain-containing protein [Candidatus Rhabdochlamydia sp. T3358]VHO02674.1 E3 ubiquitin-protein ligase SlrP [Candidatus Rhabdochlamydia sp. T3358]
MNTRISETKSPPSAFDSFERYSRMLNSLAGRIAIVIASVLYNIIALPFAAVSYLAQKVVTVWNESKRSDVRKAAKAFVNQTQGTTPYLDPIEVMIESKKEEERIALAAKKQEAIKKRQMDIRQKVDEQIAAKALSYKGFDGVLESWGNKAPKFENREEAVKRIKKVMLTNGTSLDLSNLQLSSLPDVFLPNLSGNARFLNNIQKLNLKGNNFTGIPESIKNLRSLEELSLEGNQIAVLPKEALEKLITLQVLNLKGNQITVLPENIFDNLKALLDLDLGNNQIREFPKNIFDNLELRSLSLKANELKALPESFNKLLPSLRMLNLKDNPISKDDLKMIKQQKHKDLRFFYDTNIGAQFKKKKDKVLRHTSEVFKTLGKAS